MPSLYGCDSSNCFITKTIITEETGQDGVDKHVQSLLESLHQINSNSSAEGEDPGSILEDDNDDIKESADDILVPWDDTIWQFPNQNILKTMVCCPNTGNYKGASHQGCKQKNEIIGPKWYQQPSIPDNGIFKETYKCMYCNSQMLDQGLLKVRDHCHINGKYRGPAHSNCNKKLQMGAFKTKVPLICHNFRGYDSHLLIEVAGRFTSNKLKCIPENIGKYKAMDVGQLRFLDSFQHMSMGLDKLVECMNGNLEKFPLTKKHFADKGYSLEQIKFLFRKGVFPYDWTNSWDKFKKTALPRRKDFYSLLNQQNISKADYTYAQEVWQKFEMKTFGEYHDLYLETDVLLLADVFMNYTIMCLKDDGLDPSHYVLAPGMFNDSLYKSSGAEIKLLTDLDQYMLVERAIRGGMSMVSQRYAKANNPQCPDYDESKPNSWVMYEDMNALYSGAMIQYLPTEILGKVAPEEIPNILEIPIDAEEGYLLEVDMEVPLNLHDLFNDYPLAPEKGVVPKNWLSPYNEDLVNDSEIGGGKYVLGEKLLQTLLPKKNYVVHYRALQLYINLGIKVTKIHEALKFHQSPWMKPYIEENIRKRKIAKASGDEFGVMYYKLKNNAVFGKQMENVRKHMRVELLKPEEDKKLKRLTSSPLYVGFKAFEGGITAIHMLKSQITLNKPMFVGQAILDISKAMMYNFWYGYIKPRYGEKARLLYTDTDSLIMWIETEDVYKDRAERPDLFDLNNSGDLFLMKDECKGIPISEAVCLKPKMYSVLPVGHDPKTPKTEADFEKELEEEGWQKKHGIQKAKGVKKSVVKRELRHDKFLECLKTRKITRHDMYGLRSYDHQIYLERVNKIGLNPYDNKRWILSDGIRTLPYGHWRIRAYKKFVASGVIPEEAEKRAMKLTLKPEYQ
ncbi:5994_t:CDS:2 [Entrophospora sp. SA101]|nr:5994_t:CDS:2 [Entrophospora sp. SA101]